MAGEATEDTAEITGRLAGLDAPERAEAIRTLRDVGLLAADRLAFSHPAVLDAVEESTPATSARTPGSIVRMRRTPIAS